MAEDKLTEFTKFLEENKGQRKFKQSIELAVNFKGVDFSKQANKLNLEVVLPNGRGKVSKVAVFATEKNVVEAARTNGVEVIDGTQIEAMSHDHARMNSLLDYELVAQPNLMPTIARFLGQFLGPRNKMPKPLLGSMNIGTLANDLSRKITIRTKGKNLPTVHCLVGKEDMEPKKIYDNIQEVLAGVNKSVGNNHIRSVYVKLSMSKPMKLM